MITLLTKEKTTICPFCKSHMLYMDDDVQEISEKYETYCGEYGEEKKLYIICPKCENKINLK